MDSRMQIVSDNINNWITKILDIKKDLLSQSGIDDQYKHDLEVVIDEGIQRFKHTERFGLSFYNDPKIDVKGVDILGLCGGKMKGDEALFKIDLRLLSIRTNKRIRRAKEKERLVLQQKEIIKQRAREREGYLQSMNKKIEVLQKENDEFEMTIFEDLLARVKPT